MTTITFPAGLMPSRARFAMVAPSRTFVSPFTGSTQTSSRGGDRWECQLEWDNLTDDTQRRALQATLIQLVTLEDRISIAPYGHANRGAYGGTPLIAGASQVGKSIDIDGASLSVTGWALAGDFVEISGQLVQVVADADSDGSGNVTLLVRPNIRTAPADNAAVDVTTPLGTFMLASPEVGWSVSAGPAFTSFSVSFLEDILA